MLALLVLTACFEPTETGPTGMVGRVFDDRGLPVPELSVQSLESRDVTDADGRFVVQYKDPDRFVHFRWQGTFFQRRYRVDDDGQVVELRLPALRDVEIRCELEAPADVELVWDLGDGLTARATASCRAGASIPLPRVPGSTPQLVLRAGGAEVEGSLNDAGRALHIQPPPAQVRVEVQGVDGPPQSCHVMLGGRLARPSGEGAWVGEISGPVAVTALCDGRAALPVRVERGQESVTVDWSPTGPNLDLAAIAPDAPLVAIVRQGTDGWLLRVPGDAAGMFALPPLPSGLYTVAIGDPGLLAVAPGADPSVPAGALHLRSAGVDAGFTGTLRLDGDLDDGTIRIVGPGPGGSP